jgi:hypothetical protein
VQPPLDITRHPAVVLRTRGAESGARCSRTSPWRTVEWHFS